MVPAIKAVAAFAFMEAWIKNEDYPEYDKDCDSPGGKSNMPLVDLPSSTG